MLPYRLLYSKNSVLISTIVLIPLCGIGMMFVILFNLPNGLPNWIIFSVIFFFLGLIVALLLIVIKTRLLVPCKIMVNESGISFKLENQNFFYRYNDFFSGWENISNISDSSYNEQQCFYQISFRNPNFTSNFSATKNEAADAEKFFNELTYYRDLYNLSHSKHH